MNVVALTETDRRLLATRYAEHGNSHKCMHDALVRAGDDNFAARLNALREMEKLFDLDLGLVCHLYAHRNDGTRHPIERLVIEFITDAHAPSRDGMVCVLPDRVRQVRELMQGRLVGDRE